MLRANLRIQNASLASNLGGHMRCKAYRFGAGLGLAILLAAQVDASQPWSKDYTQWTERDVQRVLTDSPWSQQANASFGEDLEPQAPAPGPLPGAPEAGMAGPRAASDGRWDGGVGRLPRGGVPSLPITIRWDSALPVRKALESGKTADMGGGDISEAQTQKDYILTVIGLIPAGRYKNSGHLDAKSRSDNPEGTVRDPQNPEQMLEGLMAGSMLLPRGKNGIRPEDVKLDAATGVLHFFFPRNETIEAKDKEVTFATRFGSMTIRKVFRLKDMTYRGKLEL